MLDELHLRLPATFLHLFLGALNREEGAPILNRLAHHVAPVEVQHIERIQHNLVLRVRATVPQRRGAGPW